MVEQPPARDIAVRDCRSAPEGFHARFDAKSKLYHYRILNRDTRSAVGRNYAWFIHRPLNVRAMGRRRSAWSASMISKPSKTRESAAHTVRNVMRATWVEEQDRRLAFQIEADDFCAPWCATSWERSWRWDWGDWTLRKWKRYWPARIVAGPALRPGAGLFLLE